LSKKIPSSGWRPEPGNLGQNGLNLPNLWHHPQKTWNPKLSNFFQCNL